LFNVTKQASSRRKSELHYPPFVFDLFFSFALCFSFKLTQRESTYLGSLSGCSYERALAILSTFFRSNKKEREKKNSFKNSLAEEIPHAAQFHIAANFQRAAFFGCLLVVLPLRLTEALIICVLLS
jgi:hypothetical protein